jgi:hypothetical protein
MSFQPRLMQIERVCILLLAQKKEENVTKNIKHLRKDCADDIGEVKIEKTRFFARLALNRDQSLPYLHVTSFSYKCITARQS